MSRPFIQIYELHYPEALLDTSNLRDNIEWATKRAREAFDIFGYHEQIAVAFSKHAIYSCLLSFKDDLERQAELSYLRTMFRRQGVHSYVFISEGWQAEVYGKENFAKVKRGDAERDPNRKEVLHLLAVSKTEKILCTMEIHSDSDRKWLGEPEYTEDNNLEGLLTTLLDEEPKEFS